MYAEGSDRAQLNAGTMLPEHVPAVNEAVNRLDVLYLKREETSGLVCFLAKAYPKLFFISSIQFEPAHWFVLKRKLIQVDTPNLDIYFLT